MSSKPNLDKLTPGELIMLCRIHKLPYSATKAENLKTLIAYYKSPVKSPKSASKPVPAPRPKQSSVTKPIPAPRPKKASLTKPVPAPRPKKSSLTKPIPAPRPKKASPVAAKQQSPIKNPPVKIGQGSAGCVYKPIFSCDPSAPMVGDIRKLHSLNTVSKITDAHRADDELHVYQNMKLDELDPSELFHIGNPLKCKPLNVTNDCPAVKTDNVLQLIYNDGGVNVKSIEPELEIIQALIGLSNVIHGIDIMHNKGIYHFDIKPDNIVMDERGTCRLIDFGLSYYQGMDKQFLTVFRNPYLFWPLDAMVFIPYGGKSHQQAWYRSKVDLYFQRGAGQILRSSGFLPDSYYDTLNFDAVISELQDLHTLHTPEEIFNESMRKVDIYSLGITIWVMYRKVRIPEVNNAIADFLQASNALHQNPFLRPEIAQFYREYEELVNTVLRKFNK